MVKALPLTCAGVAFVASGAGLWLFTYALLDRIRLDPFWTPLKCHISGEGSSAPVTVTPNITAADLNLTNESDPAIEQAIMAGTRVQFWGWRSSTCENSNHVSLDSELMGNGTLYVEMPDPDVPNATTLKPSGQAWMGWFQISAEGGGTGTMENAFNLDLATAYYLQSSPTPVNIVTYTENKVTLAFDMLGRTFTGEGTKVRWCGYKVMLALGQKGPSRCEDTLEELVIPAMDYEAGFTYEDLKAKDKEEAEQGRNLMVGLAMGVGLLISLVCSTCGLVCVRRGLHGGKSGNKSGKSGKSGVEESSESTVSASAATEV